ncbi:sugar ABC transporter substrate-binding protein [Leucobacter sp. CSA1]|uniref:Sugar ABC transporter substrate-binding protein n=1 Tax=Leucobacter chromiisoli TaxID=2796471 RepID=A0A934Q6V1_9MICO|nr:sugar ABC transporter substrate-binding protein [Leucobacter chromiisoli]MBK0418778.1 sugar ABC transporter substrate-binding protein [Leucobacter chromiisoli]
MNKNAKSPLGRLRFVATGLLAASALTLVGCAGQGGPAPVEATGEGDIPTDTEATVRVLLETVPDSDIVIDMVDEFNETYPNITVDIEQLPFDQMRDRLIASFQAPDPNYDLIVVDNPWMVDFAEAGFLQPLDARIDSTSDYDPDDFFDPLVDITTVDEARYAVPFYNYALGFIYRTDLMEEAGAEPPETLDELVSTVQQLNTPEHAGIAMQPQRGYKVFEEWANWLFAAGGSIYDDEGNVTLDTPEAAHALEAYIEAYETAAPANSLNWAVDDAVRSVSSGGSASLITYNWNLPVLNDPEGAAGDLAGEFALAPMPGGKQALGAWSWALPSNSAEPDAAWAFISWVTSPETDVERVIAGGAAIRESTLEEQRVLDEGYGAGYYDAVKTILSDASPLSEGPSGEEFIQDVGTELNKAVAGTASVEEALAAAQAAGERLE